MANLITQVKPYNASQSNIPDYGVRASAVQYGTSSTDAGTGAKAVSCTTFLSTYLTQGAIVAVKFDNTNSAAVGDLTLNVNNTGAKPIQYIYNGSLSNLPNANYLKKDQIYLLNYDTNSVASVDIPSTVPTLSFGGETTIMTYEGTAVKVKTPTVTHQTIKQDGITGATVNRFGTCSTAAATAAKTVNITTGTLDSTLSAGTRVTVKFTNANTANTPTLNVNSKGAKNIYYRGSAITTGSNKALLAGTCDFVYDGTN